MEMRNESTYSAPLLGWLKGGDVTAAWRDIGEGSIGDCRKSSFMRRGYLDDQFIQLEHLQDEANPNFVEEVVRLFYSDSVRLIQNIELAMINKPNVDFGKLDAYMHQFKGSSSSIGAMKVMKECSKFREYCYAGNIEGCIKTFQLLKQEHATLRRKLETYFQLVKQAGVVAESA
ncbi:hypothetical protein POTOM_026273 [Populus tomentosa]|uniref:Histidine-containing phosphotransfer protein n=1 Tax=Populus tomentosa TaxID=118781 RepID=A0A8X8CY44_POPTO|nr:hypothetical protein POTOM_026273 [Populus tomentosa]